MLIDESRTPISKPRTMFYHDGSHPLSRPVGMMMNCVHFVVGLPVLSEVEGSDHELSEDLQ